MKKPKISIIAAIGENQELGKNNKLLWHIPEDLERFKKLTEGHVVIMGRKTFESLRSPLPNRINVIVTKNKDYTVSLYRYIDTLICQTFKEAIKIAKTKEKKEIFIIGGGQIYQQAIDIADKLYLTIVDGNFDADTFFPDYSQFTKKIFEQKGKSENYKYRFVELEK